MKIANKLTTAINTEIIIQVIIVSILKNNNHNKK